MYTICEYAGEDGEVEDPFGGDMADYEECAEQIYDLCNKIADKIEGK